jgi:hypothetical protein
MESSLPPEAREQMSRENKPHGRGAPGGWVNPNPPQPRTSDPGRITANRGIITSRTHLTGLNLNPPQPRTSDPGRITANKGRVNNVL